MPLKKTLASALRGTAQSPLFRPLLFHPAVREKLQRVPGLNKIYPTGWDLPHPFDGEHGTETSGFIPAEELSGLPVSVTRGNPYAGSQPSIIRTTLEVLSSLNDFTFVDLGAGKGRPVLVAAEFPFIEVIGIELSSDLADLGKRNVEIMRARGGKRVPMRIEQGDAATFQFPRGNLVVFLYNPFGADVLKQVMANLEEVTRRLEGSKVYAVYYNPVQGHVFDESPLWRRYWAQMVPYSAEEIGFGPDKADPVVIWQAGVMLPPKPNADASIRIVKVNDRVELVS